MGTWGKPLDQGHSFGTFIWARKGSLVVSPRKQSWKFGKGPISPWVQKLWGPRFAPRSDFCIFSFPISNLTQRVWGVSHIGGKTKGNTQRARKDRQEHLFGRRAPFWANKIFCTFGPHSHFHYLWVAKKNFGGWKRSPLWTKQGSFWDHWLRTNPHCPGLKCGRPQKSL